MEKIDEFNIKWRKVFFRRSISECKYFDMHFFRYARILTSIYPGIQVSRYPRISVEIKVFFEINVFLGKYLNSNLFKTCWDVAGFPEYFGNNSRIPDHMSRCSFPITILFCGRWLIFLTFYGHSPWISPQNLTHSCFMILIFIICYHFCLNTLNRPHSRLCLNLSLSPCNVVGFFMIKFVFAFTDMSDSVETGSF